MGIKPTKELGPILLSFMVLCTEFKKVPKLLCFRRSFFERIFMIHDLSSYPDLLTTKHLVALGLFSSLDAAYVARRRNNSPDFIQVKRRVIYPKAAVQEFMQKHTHQGEPSAAVQSAAIKDD